MRVSLLLPRQHLAQGLFQDGGKRRPLFTREAFRLAQEIIVKPDSGSHGIKA
jgi:hypothetical protein